MNDATSAPDGRAFEPPPPYIPPPPEGPRRRVNPLRLQDPLHWLARGWRDLLGSPGIAAFYGVAFWLMAVVLAGVFRAQPEYVMSIASGCLLLGPFLAMGLYEVSRRHERGEASDLVASALCWRSHVRSMGLLVLVLIVLELLWGRASLVVFAVFFNTGMPSTAGVLEAVFNPENMDFLMAYLVVGGVFAGLVFSTSVVSIPMILDRDTDAITAAITSIEVVLRNLLPLLVWGGLIVLLVALALLLPWGVGLLLVGPWLGHATWHAYRGAVTWLEEPPAATPAMT